MLSLIMIHALNQAQAQRATDEQLYPLVVEAEDKRSWDRAVHRTVIGSTSRGSGFAPTMTDRTAKDKPLEAEINNREDEVRSRYEITWPFL